MHAASSRGHQCPQGVAGQLVNQGPEDPSEQSDLGNSLGYTAMAGRLAGLQTTPHMGPHCRNQGGGSLPLKTTRGRAGLVACSKGGSHFLPMAGQQEGVGPREAGRI